MKFLLASLVLLSASVALADCGRPNALAAPSCSRPALAAPSCGAPAAVYAAPIVAAPIVVAAPVSYKVHVHRHVHVIKHRYVPRWGYGYGAYGVAPVSRGIGFHIGLGW
jgi:hypothetical protein